MRPGFDALLPVSPAVQLHAVPSVELLHHKGQDGRCQGEPDHQRLQPVFVRTVRGDPQTERRRGGRRLDAIGQRVFLFLWGINTEGRQL